MSEEMRELEVWRPVVGFEDFYDVSNMGRVRSKHRIPWRILAPSKGAGGYLGIGLRKHGKSYPRKFHKLVCMAFHEPPVGNVETAHNNGVREDCRASNLRWATRRDNNADKERHGTLRWGRRTPSAKLDPHRATQIFNRARQGENMTALAREFGVSDVTVRNIKIGISWVRDIATLREQTP